MNSLCKDECKVYLRHFCDRKLLLQLTYDQIQQFGLHIVSCIFSG